MAFALEFPHELPPNVQVSVPRPCENHTEWAKEPYLLRIPPLVEEFIGPLPDYKSEPVVYAAAIDTIRVTNHYFQLKFERGQSQVNVVTKAAIEETSEAWQNAVLQKSVAWNRNPNRRALNPRKSSLIPPTLGICLPETI